METISLACLEESGEFPYLEGWALVLTIVRPLSGRSYNNKVPRLCIHKVPFTDDIKRNRPFVPFVPNMIQ